LTVNKSEKAISAHITIYNKKYIIETEENNKKRERLWYYKEGAKNQLND